MTNKRLKRISKSGWFILKNKGQGIAKEYIEEATPKTEGAIKIVLTAWQLKNGCTLTPFDNDTLKLKARNKLIYNV